MLSEPTLEKLKGLRFDGMAAAWNEQQQKSSDLTSLSFDERFGLLVDEDGCRVAMREPGRAQRREIIGDRHGSRSTLITSQLPVEKWHDHIGDPTIADAVCDRLLHNAHRLVLKGPSRRKEESPAAN